MPRNAFPRTLFLAAALLAVGATVSLGATGEVLHSGNIANEQWSWEPAGAAYRLTLQGGRAVQQTGRPDVDAMDLLLVLPADLPLSDIVIEPLQTHIEKVPGPLALAAPLISSEGDPVTIADLPVGDDSFPAVWGQFRGLHTWRGYRLVAVTVYPFRTVGHPDGDVQSVEVLDQFAIRAVTDPDARRPDPVQRERLVPGERSFLEATLRNLVANPDQVAGMLRQDGVKVSEPGDAFMPTPNPSLEGSAVRYLIVTTEALADEYQRLADFRTAQGLPAVVVTREWIEANGRHGVDFQETLRFFLQQAYAKWGVEYLLLGGDTGTLPTRYVRSTFYPFGGHTDIPTDLYFACLEGNWNADGDGWFCEPYSSASLPGDYADFAPELALGRAPTITVADVTCYIDKLITYETAGNSAAWANRALFLAEVLFPADWLGPGDPISLDGAIYAEQIITDSLEPCTDMTTARMYEAYMYWPGSTDLTLSATIDSLDTGHYGIVNQMGHGHYFNMSVGDGNFRTNHAAALSNDNSFLLYALNCASGAFDFACLMERFVQNCDGGAIAAIGSAREAFPATSNNYQQSFFDVLYCDQVVRVGDIINISRLPFLANTDRNTVDRWTYLNYNLQGGPAVALWTATPTTAQIAGPGSIAAGPQDVSYTITAGGSPVQGGLVCLEKAGETYASGSTDLFGQVTLHVNPVSNGPAMLTVSSVNVMRTDQAVSVTVPSTYLAAHSIEVHDTSGGSVVGNGNGKAEAGEYIELSLVVVDTGGGGATGIQAQIFTTDPGVSILVGSVPMTDIPPGGGTATSAQRFLVSLGADVTDGTVAEITLLCTASGGGSYLSGFELPILAPEAEPVAMQWEDATHGNGNGVIDNNERLVITVDLKNFGAGNLDLVEARLRSDAAGVTVYDSVGTCANVDLLQTATGSPGFSAAFADGGNPGACRLVFTDNYGRTFVHPFQLAPPTAPLEPDTDTTIGPDVIALRWDPVGDADVRGYHVYRSSDVSGPFVRVNPDLLEGISYYEDGGLGELETYFYRVTAVDSSLVEGSASAVISESTKPAEMANFPIAFRVETSSHCAVGDVVGDGNNYVVLASDEIYVWDHNGQELFDGDNDAQSNGPITNMDGQFEPAGVTLADLDGDGALEIIASERSSGNRIFIFNAEDGSILPGWPQSLSQWNWATPAVGDVDGDGDLEVVVNTLNGRTYVWHHDGTELRDGDNNPATNGVFVVRTNEWWAYSSPTLCDLDGDDAMDIIVVTDKADSDNGLYAYRYDGTQVTGFPHLLGAERSICSPAVGDLDNNGTFEIVFFSKLHYLHVVQENGFSYPGFPIYHSAPSDASSGPSPALGDLDNDGMLEIVWAVNAGGTRSDLICVDTNGSIMSGWPKQLPGNTESSPVVGDIDGDQIPDIVYGIGGGDTESPDDLFAFHADGTEVTGFPISLDGHIRPAPVITDLDWDGDVDIVLGAWDRLLHVWDMPFDYNRTYVPWPTFHANVARTGLIDDLSIIAVPDEDTPTVFATQPPYPNPFNPQTTIRLYVPENGTKLQVSVYDLRGRQIRQLFEGARPAGWHTFVWDGRDRSGRQSASGVYVMRARYGGETATYKMSLVK